MSEEFKLAEELTVADFQADAVWEFRNEDEKGESAVRPVKKLPVKNLDGCIVGTQIQLANGSRFWASLGNVDSNDPRQTQQFLFLSVFKERWFQLARYFDFNLKEQGPQALADFLGLHVDDVFPISYDIRSISLGDPSCLAGTIEKEPREKLTRAERIALSLE